MELFSDHGLYDNGKQSFLMHDAPAPPSAQGPKSKPLALGARDGRKFALTGERIIFYKDTGDVKLYNGVAGWLDAGEVNGAVLPVKPPAK